MGKKRKSEKWDGTGQRASPSPGCAAEGQAGIWGHYCMNAERQDAADAQGTLILSMKERHQDPIRRQ